LVPGQGTSTALTGVAALGDALVRLRRRVEGEDSVDAWPDAADPR